MESSEYIVAINNNDTAPIFDVADLGIVGDVKAIVPKLTEAIAKRKAEKQLSKNILPSLFGRAFSFYKNVSEG